MMCSWIQVCFEAPAAAAAAIHFLYNFPNFNFILTGHHLSKNHISYQHVHTRAHTFKLFKKEQTPGHDT